ncbi:MAG: NTPase [Candidatus Bathyarchaeia archaeon]|nr:NTPase [Candidatus Bathyarchaeota archaeon]
MAGGLVLTGRPGVGKTTVIVEVVKLLRGRDVSVGGFISREVRDKGVRIGFEVIDLASGGRGWLARAGVGNGPRIGRYTVCLKSFEEVGVSALHDALDRRDVDIVVVDEVGPMEMCSDRFKSSIKALFGGVKPYIATLHRSLVGTPLIPGNVEVMEVTFGNRNRITGEVAEKAYRLAKGSEAG